MARLTVRPDQLVTGLAEALVKKQIEPRVRNAPLWDAGIGEVIQTAVDESGISKKEFSLVDLARSAGILKRRPPR